MSVITRFAPSPTGALHIGGGRVALFCWLYAQKMAGKFILRIEDTDTERSTQESVQAILDGMEWLGLNYEGPYHQTQRFERYKEVVNQLLADGKAYKCYCSKERLEALRTEQMANKQKPRYDGLCRDKTEAGTGPFVIRFKNPQEGRVEFEDLVRGPLSFDNHELDDLIIARSEGTPTYNFVVVVDDWDMQVTHVLRGDDHINNTPRQINIMRALGATPPAYAHLPMILGPDGKRLSKRDGAASVMDYRDAGILPEALLNYLVRLGWSHGDQEIFSLAEMIDLFEIARINKAPAALNPDKLLWLNQHYLKTKDPEAVAKDLKWHLEQLEVDTTTGPALAQIVVLQRDRVKTLKEMAERSAFFFGDLNLNEAARALLTTEIKPLLKEVRDQLQSLETWSPEVIHQVIEAVANAHELKLGKLAQPLRIAITGGTVSPPIDQTLSLLGRDPVISRLTSSL